MTQTKRTPLYDRHVSLGAKMVPFAGWEMPVQYSGLIEEHRAVRERVGLFDVSHMGELIVSGQDAEKFLEYVTCNRVSSLQPGRARYNAITNSKGGVVDDIIIYKIADNRFLICVNASNAEKDFKWLSSNNTFNCKLENLSDDYGQIALQGPKAHVVLDALFEKALSKELFYFEFKEYSLRGIPIIVARTGYTGEDGFELFLPAAKTVEIWDELLEFGSQEGILPCGLGARDTLRLEVGFRLYGHELRDDISAYESGLGWIIKLDKGDFVGSDSLSKEKEAGSKRALVGLELLEAGIAREETEVISPFGSVIGAVTSGTKTPTLGKSVAIALIDKSFAKVDTELNVRVRGRDIKVKVIKKPFYKTANPAPHRAE